MRTIVTFLAVAALQPIVAVAQERDTTMIPRELALALIGSPFSPFSPTRPPVITVGRTPADFPRELVPAGARVLGALSTPANREMSRSTTVVAAGPDSAPAASAAFQTALERAGWKTPPMPETVGGGFVGIGDGQRGYSLCRDSTSLWFSVLPRDRGGSLYHITYTPSMQRFSVCNPENLRRMTAYRHESFTFPTLRPPAGAYSRGGGSCGSDNSREANTDLETSLDVTELITHYANQLQNQGWTLGARTGDSTMALQLAKGKDDKGRELTGILGAVATSSPRERTVFFRINAATDDR